MNETKYGVFLQGGSVGEANDEPVKEFTDKEEAKAFARRRRSTLSKGERQYYKMTYVVRPLQESIGGSTMKSYLEIYQDGGDSNYVIFKAADNRTALLKFALVLANIEIDGPVYAATGSFSEVLAEFSEYLPEDVENEVLDMDNSKEILDYLYSEIVKEYDEDYVIFEYLVDLEADKNLWSAWFSSGHLWSE